MTHCYLDGGIVTVLPSFQLVEIGPQNILIVTDSSCNIVVSYCNIFKVIATSCNILMVIICSSNILTVIVGIEIINHHYCQEAHLENCHTGKTININIWKSGPALLQLRYAVCSVTVHLPENIRLINQ